METMTSNVQTSLQKNVQHTFSVRPATTTPLLLKPHYSNFTFLHLRKCYSYNNHPELPQRPIGSLLHPFCIQQPMRNVIEKIKCFGISSKWKMSGREQNQPYITSSPNFYMSKQADVAVSPFQNEAASTVHTNHSSPQGNHEIPAQQSDHH